VRVVIVDDEPLARSALRRLLAAHPDVEIAGEADTLSRARAALEELRPDLVFLDIELDGSGGDGFDLLQGLGKRPVVVFVTAFAQYAVDAFAVEATDYLLKPVDPLRLAEALARAGRLLAVAPPTPEAGVIELKMPRRTVLATPAEIVALCAEGDFTRVFVVGQPALMILRALGQFEALLPAPPFLRLGRSVMINRDRLRGIEAASRAAGRLTLEGLAEPLSVSRAAVARLREAMTEG
jgi:two-component system, LytTR family, response regulator